MPNEEKEKLYFAHRKLECIKSILILVDSNLNLDDEIGNQIKGRVLELVIANIEDVQKELEFF